MTRNHVYVLMKEGFETGPICLRRAIGRLFINRPMMLLLAMAVSLPPEFTANGQDAVEGNSNAGYEEWAARKAPEGSSTLLLLGLALIPLGLLRARVSVEAARPAQRAVA